MSVTKSGTRRFRVEQLEERVAPACFFWDGPSDQMAVDPAGAAGTSMSTALEPVRESLATSPLLRGFQGTVLAHLGGTRSDRANRYANPLTPQEVTELLDDIDRRFNQPLPENPLDLLEEIDQTFNQPLRKPSQDRVDEIDRRDTQSADPLPQVRGTGVS